MPEATVLEQEKLPPTEGNQTPEKVEQLNPEPTYTKVQLDAEAAKIRRATEAETKRQLLAKLGLKPDEEAKLEALKATYESTLSKEEKLTNDNQLLQQQVSTLTQQLEEKDYLVAALSAMGNIELAKIETIVKMARGLKDDNTTIQEAINTVITMTKTITTPTTAEVPVGQPLAQPNGQHLPPPNPWKEKEWNLTDQGKIFKADPAKARQMAKEAGVNLAY